METAEHTITIPADQYGRVAPVEVAKLLSRMANTGIGDEDWKFAEAFVNEHPTLQQKMMGYLLTAVVAMAELHRANRTDGRNERSADIAEQIRFMLYEAGMLFQPTQRVKDELEHSIYSGTTVKFPSI